MTAEILIINRSAIAMATDSAVTIGSEKTFTGVNKLFMLSNNPPMGIMIYGNADFMDIPMESLIKEYRKKCEIEKYTTVKKFMENFLIFIEDTISNPENFSYFFENMLENIIINMSDELKNRIKLNPDETLKSVNDEMEEHHNLLYNDEVFEKCSDIVKKMVEKHFDNVDSAFKNNIGDIIKKLYILNTCHITGIVIAGFNQKDMYPSFSSYDIYTIFNEKFFYKKLDEKENFPAPIILPFAQTDVMDNFLMGVNSDILYDLNIYVQKLVNHYPDFIKNMVSEVELDKKCSSILKNVIKQIKNEDNLIKEDFNELIDQRVKKSFQPIFNSIGALPKEELANMCESLIHITSLRRKVEEGLESVGGEIDVAIISKGDGFIWAKRKHYFNPELNPQFFHKRL